MNLFAELQRRNVFRVAVAYVIAAWLLLQLTEVLTELLDVSTDVGKIVVVLLIIGFVPTVFFAWAFELTPEGIKRESEVDRSQSTVASTGQKLNRAIIAMLVLVAGYFFWESRFKESAEPPVAPLTQSEPAAQDPSLQPDTSDADTTRSIAVLPFVNMSDDPAQEFFSDGLSEEILNALAKIDDLRVISRTSAFAFKGKELSIPQIAEQLGVSHVLEGSVRTADDKVRITAQLIEVDSDSHLWSEAYSRNLEDVFEIQEEISRAIASQLQLRLVSGVSKTTEDIEAYQLFLQGRHYYQDRGVENMDRAIRALSQATDIDPNFDEAWANLAAASIVRAYSTELGFEDYMKKGDAAAERAIAINPRNGFGHAVLGLRAYGLMQFDEALEKLTLAIELNPNESNSYLWRAIVRLGLGYIEQALDDLRYAESLDPVFTNLHNWLISGYLCSGQFDLAEHHYNRLIELRPDFQANYFGEIEILRGNLDQGEQRALAGSSEISPQAVRATYAALRDPAKTEAAVAILLAERSQGNFSVFLPLLLLGEVDLAIIEWKALMASGRGLRALNQLGSLWLNRGRQWLGNPAFQTLFEEVGMADHWRAHGAPDFCRAVGDRFECG